MATLDCGVPAVCAAGEPVVAAAGTGVAAATEAELFRSSGRRVVPQAASSALAASKARALLGLDKRVFIKNSLAWVNEIGYPGCNPAG